MEKEKILLDSLKNCQKFQGYPENFIKLWKGKGLNDNQVEIFIRLYLESGSISQEEYDEILRFLEKKRMR